MAAGLSLSGAFTAVAIAACGEFAHAFEPLIVAGEPSLQVQWQPAKDIGRRPAIIALLGCGGLYNSLGRFDDRYPGIVAVRAYADGYHGFDSRAPVRFRPDIPAGVDKRGVHVGGNPTAREASLSELDQFLARYLQST